MQLHLLDNGVELGPRGHAVPKGAVDLEELLGMLMECGLQVRACGMLLNERQLELIEGIKTGSMEALAAWVKNSDHVLTF